MNPVTAPAGAFGKEVINSVIFGAIAGILMGVTGSVVTKALQPRVDKANQATGKPAGDTKN